MMSSAGRRVPEHSRNRPRSTDAREAIMKLHGTLPSQGRDWPSQALCKGQPTEIFFAADNERGVQLRRNERCAKQICWSCPVLEACRSYALNAHEPYGIWGGLTPSERRRVRAANSRRALGEAAAGVRRATRF